MLPGDEKTSGNTRKIRIGIDVGGTFTHAVALDALDLRVIGKVKVPTSHKSREGVARGIIDSLLLLLQECGIKSEEVIFIAHSTTQATNALLEGDVAKVGILALGAGLSSWLASLSTRLGKIELAPGRYLHTVHDFVDTAGVSTLPLAASASTVVSPGVLPVPASFNESINVALDRLIAAGAQAIAVSEAFGVDNPELEEYVVGMARSKGLLATCGSEVSKLYGLKVRTRTAAINAAMLPKMLETANMTEKSVREAGIKAPIMIMRSDGGVMDIDSMRKRPILTRLSGPAAGVAAAMMYLNITDGIFLEVGGTSTDISVIKNGRALVKDAEIGGHRVHLRSLDVTTLGVAGGSMVRISNNGVRDVGPRSAHIAGLQYSAFSSMESDCVVHKISPKQGDPDDYLALSSGGEVASVTITPTCAANFLSYVPAGDCAVGDKQSVEKAFAAVAGTMGSSAEQVARAVLDKAYQKILPVVKRLAQEYKLELSSTTLVGGGGGAAALVPYVAEKLGCEHLLALNADVVSAIGVALALVRETIERQVPQPQQEDLIRIREEAFAAVATMGADPASIEVHVEIDARQNILRATAYGATKLTESAALTVKPSPDELKKIAAHSLRLPVEHVTAVAAAGDFHAFTGEKIEGRLFGLIPLRTNSLRFLDGKGVVRLRVRNGKCVACPCADVESTIQSLAEQYSAYGDAGRIIPDFILFSGHRLIDLSGLMDTWQVQTLCRSELAMVSADTVVLIAAVLPD